MRAGLGMAGTVAAALAGCSSGPPLAAPEYLDAQVKQMSESEFAVGVEARNVDEYAYARCVAANYAKYQQAPEFAQLEGPTLKTRFFINDEGQRVTYSYGVLRFTVATDAEDAPKQRLPVKETLARCAERDIPVAFRAAKAG